MRQKKVWRYYCDYCRKSKGTRQSMEQHERHCTANPNRECRMCEMNPDHVQRDMAEILNKGLCKTGCEISYDALVKATGGCPACMLAVLRQGGCFLDKDFNYQTAARKWREDNPWPSRYEE